MAPSDSDLSPRNGSKGILEENRGVARADHLSSGLLHDRLPGQSARLDSARRSLETLKGQLLSAAVSFADGVIEAGQLIAIRKLYQAQEEELGRIEAGNEPMDPTPAMLLPPSNAIIPDGQGWGEQEPVLPEPPKAGPLPEPRATPIPEVPKGEGEARKAIADLDRKLAAVEVEYRAGRINVRQFEAIVGHYRGQREVARRMLAVGHGGDRWRVVLAEGKTTFLRSQLEARCMGVAIHDAQTQKRLFVAGEIPPEVEATLPLLGSFRQPPQSFSEREILGTDLEDGRSISLVVGEYTAALVLFSQRPPTWQLNVCNELHLNFERANRRQLALGNPNPRRLVFPDFSKIIRGS